MGSNHHRLVRPRLLFGGRQPAVVSMILGTLALVVVAPTASVPAGAATPVTDSSLGTATGITCTSSTNCLVTGYDSAGTSGQVTTFNGTSFGSLQTVSGVTQLLGVACADASVCIAVGYGGSGIPAGVVVVPVYNGVAGAAQAVSGTSELEAISCPSSTLCVASGTTGAYAGGVPLSSVSPTAGRP